jgi:hypothetical protein
MDVVILTSGFVSTRSGMKSMQRREMGMGEGALPSWCAKNEDEKKRAARAALFW